MAGRQTAAQPGRHISGYAILRELGRGGMAVVHLARQPGLDRLVALKQLLPIADARLARRFVLESRLAGSLAHPNVIIVHDRFEADGTLYIAMEYAPGGALRPYVGRLSFAQNVAVLEGVLAGLAHAESHGIVHRDIKPENVMVTVAGGVKIADFGIAKATTQLWSGTALTASGVTLGTPAYIAPEQAMAQPVGPSADLYSVGCMAYELFTGSVPFGSADQPMAMLVRRVNEEPPAAADVAPDVDRRISDWIAGLLRRDPRARPQRAEHAWRQLEEIVIAIEGACWRRGGRLASSGGAAAIPESGEFALSVPAPVEPPIATNELAPASRSARRSRRRPRVALTVTLLGLITGVAAALPGLPPPRSQPPAHAIAAGKLRLQPPAGWSLRTPAVHIPGLALIDAVSLGDGRAGVAVVGIAPRSAHRGALLSDEFTHALGTPPAGVDITLRRNFDALRYDGLRPLGLGRTVTVYAVPTSAGVATVACADPAGERGTVAVACRAIAGSLRVPGGRTFPLGPNRTFGEAVDAELRRLMATLRSGRRNLQGARRADAASTLAASYRDAFAALEPIAISPADEAVQRPLLAALRAAGLGYRDLAVAVQSHDALGDRAAAARAERGERRVMAAQRRLRAHGYRDLIGQRFRAAAIPRSGPDQGGP